MTIEQQVTNVKIHVRRHEQTHFCSYWYLFFQCRDSWHHHNSTCLITHKYYINSNRIYTSLRHLAV